MVTAAVRRALAVILLLSIATGTLDAAAQSGPSPAATATPATPPATQPATPPATPPAPGAPDPAIVPPPGFALDRVEVAAERDRPQACFVFTHPLPQPGSGGVDLAGFVAVDPPATAVTVSVRDGALCLDGLGHGRDYAVTLAAGLPAAGDGGTLAAAVARAVSIPDRRSSIAFRGQGYILPRIGPEGLPLRTVNVDRARLRVLRIGERALVEKIYAGRVNQTLTDFDVGTILDAQAETVWRGEIAVGPERNRTVVTPFPLEVVLGSLAPGVYVAVAEDAALPTVAWDQRATQWFVVSDLALTGFRAADGLTVFARRLSTAQPLPGVELRLVGRDKRDLGRAVTGPDGLARLPADALDGEGGEAPQAVFAAGPDGGFALLDVARPAEALTGAGMDGRAPAGELDAWLFAARPAIRPGDPLQVGVLLRDRDMRAVPGRRLVLRLLRPDGLEVDRQLAADAGQGAHAATFQLPEGAPAGTWTVVAHPDDGTTELGRTTVSVGRVAPVRLDLALSADRPRIAADGRATLTLGVRDPFGGPATGLSGTVTVELRPAATPHPDLPDFRFGLAQDGAEVVRRDLPGFTTTARGSARIALDLAPLPPAGQPLEAVMQATVTDSAGTPVATRLVLPVDHQPFVLGLRPHFAGAAVPEGATVGFDLLALAPDGQAIARTDVAWELYEEDNEYVWFESDGRWDYKAVVKDRRLTGGRIDIPADGPAILEEQVPAGRFRLEVVDPETGVASSVRFSAGWWVSARQGGAPDSVAVAGRADPHQPGSTAKVFVQPPYDATVLVAVAIPGRGLSHTAIETIPAAGSFLEVPLPPAAVAGGSAGVHVLATAFAPLADRAAQSTSQDLPRRAAGAVWLPFDTSTKQLRVAIEPPAKSMIGDTVTIPVRVTVPGGADPQPGTAHLAVVAVEDRPEAQARLDPAAWFLGRPRLALDLQDGYGPLLDPAAVAAGGLTADRLQSAPPPRPPALRRGSRPDADRRAGPVGDIPPVTLWSGVVPVGADGTATVTLSLPATPGRLRLQALAWSAERVGHAAATLTVDGPLALALPLPGPLAPGDTARIRPTVENLAAPPGPFAVALSGTGAVTVAEPGETVPRLAAGRSKTLEMTVTATQPGSGRLGIAVTGPDGIATEYAVGLTVRPASLAAPGVFRDLPPGGVLDLPPDQVADPADMLAADMAEATLVVAPSPLPDPVALLRLTEAEPALATVDIASHLLSLLYAGGLVPEPAVTGEAAPHSEIRRLIDRLALRQRSDGAFAAGSDAAVAGPADPWLTAFALDVLVRAREAGHRMPEEGFRRGIDWLVRTVGNSWVEDAELSARAYALLVAVRAGAIDASPVRVFQETHLSRLGDRLARAQVAAALARAGDGDRAAQILAQVLAQSQAEPGPPVPPTSLRDRAAVLSLLAGAGAPLERLHGEMRTLVADLPPLHRLTAQERAWLLVATAGLGRRDGEVTVRLGGTEIGRPAPLVLTGAEARQGPLENTGSRPLSVRVGAIGGLAAPDAGESHGLVLERRLFDPSGKPLDPAALRVGDPVIVLLEGRVADAGAAAGPLHLVERLPGGLTVEALQPAGVRGRLDWLGPLSPVLESAVEPGHIAVVALAMAEEAGTSEAAETVETAAMLRVAYLARAAVAGDFAHPGAVLRDPAGGGRYARTGAGGVTIAPQRAGRNAADGG